MSITGCQCAGKSHKGLLVQVGVSQGPTQCEDRSITGSQCAGMSITGCQCAGRSHRVLLCR